MALPDPGMAIDRERTALLVTDPQNDFLSEDGVTWGVVSESVTENNTVENIETLLKTAKENEIAVFISPHYYYPTDHEWKFEGALEALMHQINMFDRKGPLSLEGFTGSGADWLERYKEYIEDGKTVIASPHKVYGPQNNDLVLQLRKRGIEKIISPACRPTCAWNRTCANCWSKDSKWQWSPMRPQLQKWKKGTAMPRPL